tara:strand:- start:56 stop:379 length:324 start_codon:yes stop_codon:yes gene_type:complete
MSQRGKLTAVIFFVVLLLLLCLRPPIVLVNKEGRTRVSVTPLLVLSSLAAIAVYFRDVIGAGRDRTVTGSAGAARSDGDGVALRENKWTAPDEHAMADAKVVHIGRG